jgi:diketogulonate reductase-like aldo/keto reductase
MARRAITDTLPLLTGHKIPQLGFGVYQSPADVCEASCLTALRHGYRHIDTAQLYRNEQQVGDAVARSDLPRSELFITTKILRAAGSVDASYARCVESVDRLGGSVDLFLVHSPNSGAAKRKEMWLALERLFEEGRARSIGVSNYGVAHIEEMKEFAKVWPPHVNQIEVSELVAAALGGRGG